MRLQEKARLERLYERVDALEREVAELKAKKRPGRPRKDANDG